MGEAVEADDSIITTKSVLFDGLIVMGGKDEMVVGMLKDPRFKEFVSDAYKHYKPIAAYGNGVDFGMNAIDDLLTTKEGVLNEAHYSEVVEAFKQIRFWNR